jgi:TldD protein
MSQDVVSILADCLRDEHGFVELRYHAKTSRSVSVEKGRVESSMVNHRVGTGVRVLEAGVFGFSSCSSVDPRDIKKAITQAREAARRSAARKTEKIQGMATCALAVGHFEIDGTDDVLGRSLEEKVQLAYQAEARTRAAGAKIATAICTYREIFEEKAIATSDGALCSFRLVRPEFRVSAVAESGGERQSSSRTVGVTGGWDCLFRDRPADEMGESAAQMATDLLTARRPDGGRATVILAPSIVGLLVHEAIGHTVEADFVKSGSVAQGKLGQRVGSELVTLCDSGHSEHGTGAGGSIPVDDEGVPAQRTVIIDQGILRSYLHDRTTAAHFGVSPTGSARAWEYSDVPLVRMRNTYLEPGTSSLEEMIAGTPDGYLLDGPRNGQADATGEFMFNVERAWKIRDGKLAELNRGISISGIAFDVMQTVDAVSREFKWDLGAGYCGKGQPAKVDAGGPYVRCRVLLGGSQ